MNTCKYIRIQYNSVFFKHPFMRTVHTYNPQTSALTMHNYPLALIPRARWTITRARNVRVRRLKKNTVHIHKRYL